MKTGRKAAIYLLTALVVSVMAVGLPATAYGLDVTLEWAKNPDHDSLAGYIISYKLKAADGQEPTDFDEERMVEISALGSGDFLQYELTGLTAPGENENYWFSVRAYTDDGDPADEEISDHSDFVNIDEDAPPAIPTNLAVDPTSITTATLTWDMPDPAIFGESPLAGFKVYLNAETTPLIDIDDPNDMSHDLTDLDAETSYDYYVTAYTEAGDESLRSGPVTLHINSENEDPSWPAGAELTATVNQTPTLRVSLEWDAAEDNVGISKYVITREGDGHTTTFEVAGSTLVYEDENVAHNTTYAYSVVAHDHANPANTSDPLQKDDVAVLDTTDPSEPTGITTDVTHERVILEWNAATDNSGIGHYVVTRTGWAVPQTVTGLSLEDNDVVIGETYTYTIAAVDTADRPSSAASSDQITIPPEPTKPEPPTGFDRALVDDQDNFQVNLSWTASVSDPVTGYKIGRRTTASGAFDPLVTVDGKDTEAYVDEEIQHGVTYTYQIVAYNSGFESDPVETTPLAVTDGTAPTAPVITSHTIETSPGLAITINWSAATDNAGVERYVVSRSGGSVVFTPVELTGDTLPTTYNDEADIVAGVNYEYTVTAHDAVNATGSTPYLVTIDKPDEPTNFQAELEQSPTTFQVKLTWTAVAGVDGYNIYRGDDLTPLETIDDGTTVEYIDEDVDHGGSYTYHIAAVADSVESDRVDATLNNIQDTQNPPTPGRPTLDANTPVQVRIGWQAVVDNDQLRGYRVYRGGAEVTTAIITARSFTDDNVTPGETYSYTVRAFDVAGNRSAASPARSVTVATERDNEPPTKPGQPTLTYAQGVVSIGWALSSDNVGVHAYMVYRSDGQNAIGTVDHPNPPATSASYSDDTVVAGETYTYHIVAVDEANNESDASDNSDSITIPNSSNGEEPSKPSNIGKGEVTATSIEIVWDACTDSDNDLVGYRVYRIEGQTEEEVGGRLVAEERSLVDDNNGQGLEVDTSYTYQVEAYDAAGNTNRSRLLVVSTLDSEGGGGSSGGCFIFSLD